MPTVIIHNAATGEIVEQEVSEQDAAALRPDPSTFAQREHDRIRAERLGAFQAEADPLFFAWQRGEGTEEDWLAKCAEIRARYPYA
jgi:hypothetical protein